MVNGLHRDAARAEPDTVALFKALSMSPSATANARLRLLLEELHPVRLPKVSNRMRSWRDARRPFDEITPRQARGLLSRCADPVVVAAILSMHRDGRVRQVAVKILARRADPVAVPFLLLRCGDWVAAVREAALQAIEPWLDVGHLDVLLRCHPLLAGARFADSRPARHMPGRFLELFDRPEARPILMHDAASRDAITRREATRLLLRSGPTVELLEQAVTTGDTVVIGLASRDLATEGPINEAAGRLLITQRSPRLRQEGLFRLLKAGGDEANELASRFMLDRAVTVRATAQRWFANNGGDVAAYYRSLGAGLQREALLGLGDHPDPADADFARSLLTTPPGTRRASLRLLSQLGLTEDCDVFVDALLHGSEREVRESLVWFTKSGAVTTELDSIWSQPATEASAVRVLLRLAPLADNWRQIEFGLRACRDYRPPIRDAAVLLLKRSSHRPNGFRATTDARLAELRVNFAAARPYLKTQPQRFGQPSLTDRLVHLLRER